MDSGHTDLDWITDRIAIGNILDADSLPDPATDGLLLHTNPVRGTARPCDKDRWNEFELPQADPGYD
jgi:hypothetical protein